MKRKKWFVFFSSETYFEEPSFYNPEKFQWARELEALAPQITEEVKRISQDKNAAFQPYFIEKLSGKDGWKTYSFKTWGVNVNKALSLSPVFEQIANQYPQIVSISINSLPSHSRIAPHHGDSNTFYRSHLGIDIPAGLPECGFRVNQESRPWGNGKFLIFNDGNNHEAWNESEEDRTIVVFDVLREEHMRELVLITTKVRSILILQLLFTKFSKLESAPRWLLRIIRFHIQLLLIGIYPIQQVTGVLKKHN